MLCSGILSIINLLQGINIYIKSQKAHLDDLKTIFIFIHNFFYEYKLNEIIIKIGIQEFIFLHLVQKVKKNQNLFYLKNLQIKKRNI